MISYEEFNSLYFHMLLDRMWHEGSIYQTKHGQEVLQQLLADPKRALAQEELQHFSDIQAKLQTSDLVLECELAINLTILYSQRVNDDKDISYFCATHIREALRLRSTIVYFNNRDFRTLTMNGWIALKNALQKSPITQLSLMNITIEDYNDDEYNAILSLISIPHLTSLYLGENCVFDAKTERVKSLIKTLASLNCLQNLNLTTTCIRNGDIASLCELIALISAETLDISNGFMQTFDVASWRAFWLAVRNSKNLRRLCLGRNNLDSMNSEQWKAFCEGIAASPLTDLKLEYNDFDDLNEEELRMLLQAISTSKITSISFAEVDVFEREQWDLIYQMLKNNCTLQEIRVKNQPISAVIPLGEVLSENKYIYRYQIKAQTILDKMDLTQISENEEDSKEDGTLEKDREPIELIKEIFLQIETGLKSALSILDKRKSIDADQKRAHIKGLLEELQYKKARIFADRNETGLAVDTWLDVSIDSKHFQQARTNAFEATYVRNYTTSEQEYLEKSGKKVGVNILKQKQVIFRRMAFLQALPCLLEEQQILQHDNQKLKLKLTEDQQKIFDNFLFAAAGGNERDLNWQFKGNERVALLQYIVLSDIASNESVLFGGLNKRMIFLKRLNLLVLNNVHAGRCQNEQDQKLLLNVWRKFTDYVEQIGEQDYQQMECTVSEQNRQDAKIVKAISQLITNNLTATNETIEVKTSEPSSELTDFFKGNKRLVKDARADQPKEPKLGPT